MTQSARRFAELLQEGIIAIADRTSKPKGVIRDELGYAIGRKGGSAIEYWAYGDGRIPRQQSEVEALARILVDVGKLDRNWLAAFLKSAGYPDREELVTELFPGAANRLPDNLALRPTFPNDTPNDGVNQDLLKMPDAGLFCGRADELSQLKQWIVDDACRLCAIPGVGGVGKTSLAAKFISTFIEQITKQKNPNRPFDKILWRSLLNAPPLADVLGQSIRFFSNQQIIELPASFDEQLRLVTQLFQQQRCLLILDNAESIMQEGGRVGSYRPGYEGYGQLIQRIAQSDHQSCLLLTSRESPQGLTRFVRETPLVRLLHVVGLSDMAAQQILAQLGFADEEPQIAFLIERYSGHPLALKLVAETIDELYFGDVAAFLAAETFIFGDISDVLDQHFARLSPLEKEIMTWLAIEREPISVQALRDNLLGPVNQRDYLEALRALQQRSLLEKQQDGFTLQNVIIEYTTDRFIHQVCQELEQNILGTFNRHALLKAQAKEYVRASQTRLILQPILDWLQVHFRLAGLEARLKEILGMIRKADQPGYAGANILNLLLHLGSKLDDFDFSGLTMYQAYMAGRQVTDINLAGADLSRAVFTDTFGAILAVAFSPSEELLAASTADGKILLWRTTDDQPIRIWLADPGWINSVAFSPDGQTLVTGGLDQSVHLWDISTGQCLKTLPGHTSWVNSVAFSPTGQTLASGSRDQMIRLWDVQTGHCLKTLSGHTDAVRSVAFSPDGQFVVSGSEDQSVRLWAVATGQLHNILVGHTDEVRSVAFSPDGQSVASGSADQKVCLWDVTTGQLLNTLAGHSNWIRSVAFSPDGQTLVIGSNDRMVHLWDVVTGQFLKTLAGHTSEVQAVAFSPDSQTVASSAGDGSVRLWDATTGYNLKTWVGYTNRLWSVAFSPDNQTLASGGDDGTVCLWAVATGQCLKTLSAHASMVHAVAFSHDGRALASSSADHTVRLWDVATGQCLKTWEDHTNRIRSVAFSPDGQTLASSDDRTIRLWDITKVGPLETDQSLKTLAGHDDQIYSVAFCSEGQTIASGSSDRMVCLWDVATGQCLKTLEGHSGASGAVAFSPDGRFLATSGSADQMVRLWDVGTGQLFETLLGHTGGVMSVAFSPDGKLLASGSLDHTIRLWDVANKAALETSESLKLFSDLTNAITAVAFSPDGHVIVSSGDDGTVTLWDIQTGDCLKTLRPDRPYERMNITGVTGITEAQKTTLKALGAVDLA